MFTQLLLGLLLALILQLLLLYPDAVLSDVDGDWEFCPTNITVYRNCNATIHAIFNTTSHKCDESGFVYHIFIRHSDSNDVNDFKKFGPEDPVSPVVINEAHSRCNISETSVVKRAAGVYDVKFQFISNVPSIIPKECHDTLFIEDSIPPPIITSTTITCNGVLIEWERPTLAGGYNVLEYIIIVSGTTINDTISAANNSTYLIPYKEGLEYDKEYNISVTALYCGGTGNTTTTTVYTALAPLIDYVNVEDLNSKLNSSHGYIYKTFEVSACEVSYPKTVTVDLKCTRSSTHSSWNNYSISKPVTIRHDNTVIVDIIVPVDRLCSIALSFNNENLTTSISSSDINTNQLQSCSSSVSGNIVFILCTFSPLSSLWGCRVELTSTTDSSQITQMDIAMSKSHGYFSNASNGVYVIKCYGLEEINPSSTTGTISGTATRKVITYGDDGSHSTVITVESAGYHCGSTITTAPVPSINPVVRMDDHQCTPITAALAVSAIIILILVLAIVVLMWKRYKCTVKKKITDKRYSSVSNAHVELREQFPISVTNPKVVDEGQEQMIETDFNVDSQAVEGPSDDKTEDNELTVSQNRKILQDTPVISEVPNNSEDNDSREAEQLIPNYSKNAAMHGSIQSLSKKRKSRNSDHWRSSVASGNEESGEISPQPQQSQPHQIRRKGSMSSSSAGATRFRDSKPPARRDTSTTPLLEAEKDSDASPQVPDDNRELPPSDNTTGKGTQRESIVMSDSQRVKIANYNDPDINLDVTNNMYWNQEMINSPTLSSPSGRSSKTDQSNSIIIDAPPEPMILNNEKLVKSSESSTYASTKQLSATSSDGDTVTLDQS